MQAYAATTASTDSRLRQLVEVLNELEMSGRMHDLLGSTTTWCTTPTVAEWSTTDKLLGAKSDTDVSLSPQLSDDAVGLRATIHGE